MTSEDDGGERYPQLSFSAYQERTEETAIYPNEDGDGVAYTVLGLNGEAGECAEKVKKALREGDAQYLQDLEDEIGDVLWYLARFADELGFSLENIAERNLEKLQDREERDVLTGEGDDR